jgi:hypothetical protein
MRELPESPRVQALLTQGTTAAFFKSKTAGVCIAAIGAAIYAGFVAWFQYHSVLGAIVAGVGGFAAAMKWTERDSREKLRLDTVTSNLAAGDRMESAIGQLQAQIQQQQQPAAMMGECPPGVDPGEWAEFQALRATRRPQPGIRPAPGWQTWAEGEGTEEVPLL